MQDFENLSTNALRDYMTAKHERDYLLVDVRQPMEYTQGHIPGARLIPLMELESQLFDLPADRDLVFYCRSGGRSMAASALAAEAEVTRHRIYNLTGGILAWDGKTLEDYPRVQVFEATGDIDALLMTAMDLEKGAWRYYTGLVERFADQPFADVFERLSKAETAHARSVYGIWEQGKSDPEPFPELYDRLGGEILEGGEALQDVVRRVDRITDDPCLTIMELSLHIEYSAFDLYRHLAARTEDPRAAEAFLTIAQAEKAHIRSLAKAVAVCPGMSPL